MIRLRLTSVRQVRGAGRNRMYLSDVGAGRKSGRIERIGALHTLGPLTARQRLGVRQSPAAFERPWCPSGPGSHTVSSLGAGLAILH